MFRPSVGLLYPVALCGLLTLCAAWHPDGSYSLGREAPGLSPADLSVIQAPFAPPGSRDLLRTRLAGIAARHDANLLLPKAGPPTSPDARTMGWSKPDLEYWRSIPEAAKTIPQDWSRLPGVRYANSELGGMREVRLLVGLVYDQWLLTDPRHNLYACISVERRTRRVYFMEIARAKATAKSEKWEYHSPFDNCYSCHPSGPRAIRPLNEQGVDSQLLAKFNRRILGYHACDFGDSVDETRQGEPVAEGGCKACHNGVNRGRLYAVHRHTMEFKAEQEKTMPPG